MTTYSLGVDKILTDPGIPTAGSEYVTAGSGGFTAGSSLNSVYKMIIYSSEHLIRGHNRMCYAMQRVKRFA